jgi:hypothetical protein
VRITNAIRHIIEGNSMNRCAAGEQMWFSPQTRFSAGGGSVLVAGLLLLVQLPKCSAKAFFGVTECTTSYYLEPITFLCLMVLVFLAGHGTLGTMFSKFQQCFGGSKVTAPLQPSATSESISERERASAEEILGEETRDCEWWYYIRTFDSFRALSRRGKMTTFFHKYSSSSYKDVIGVQALRRGVMNLTWEHALLHGLFTGCISWAYFHIKCSADEEMYAEVSNLLRGAADTQSQMVRLTCFLLAVYVNSRMTNHVRITQRCWSLRGSLITLAAQIGNNVPNRPLQFLQYKYHCFKLMTLLHFSVYKVLDPDTCNVYTWDYWYSRGLLTSDELAILKKPGQMPIETIVGWLSQLALHRFPDTYSFDPLSRRKVVAAVVKARASASGVIDTASWLPPCSQPQLLAVIVEFFLLVTPISLVVRTDMFNAARSPPPINSPAYVWPMLGSSLLTLFFLGLLNLVKIVEDPFGEDLDDLNPDSLLMKTDWQMATLLQMQIPQSLSAYMHSGKVKAIMAMQENYSHDTPAIPNTPDASTTELKANRQMNGANGTRLCPNHVMCKEALPKSCHVQRGFPNHIMLSKSCHVQRGMCQTYVILLFQCIIMSCAKRQVPNLCHIAIPMHHNVG